MPDEKITIEQLLDKAEALGRKRGRLEMLEQILLTMLEKKSVVIHQNSLREMANEIMK